MSKLRRPSARTVAFLVPLSLAVVAVPAIALADTAPANPVYSACLLPGGLISNVGVNALPISICDVVGGVPVGVPMSWNAQGQAGTNGVSGHEVKNVVQSIAAKSTSVISVGCSSGLKPLGGGVSGVSSISQIVSFPTSTGWTVRAKNSGASAHNARAYVICASVT